MAKTENYTHYVCDRCGADAYLAANSAAANDWRDVERFDQYGSKAGKAVYLYAGTCCAQLGNWEEALVYLKKYNGKDPILAARAIALQGDCKAALGDAQQAASLYEKAAAKADNLFAAAYLVKAGQMYLSAGQNDKALKAFQTVKDKYPQSIEGYDIDKNIKRESE